MKALALLALLQSTPTPPAPDAAPAYPLSVAGPRSFHEVRGPKLVDFSYELEDGLKALHTFSAGVQFGTRAVARAWFQGDDRMVELQTWRLRAHAGQIGGETQAGLRFVAARSTFDARAVFHRVRNGDGGATLLGGWRRNLTDRLDFEVRLQGETKSVRFPRGDRATRSAAVGLAYQAGPSFEAEATGELRRVHTTGGLEFDESDVSLRFAGTLGGAVYDLTGRSVGRNGKYTVRNTSVALETAVPLAARLLLEAEGDARLEQGGGVRQHRARGSIGWFARRVRLSRTGASASRAFDLSRLATANGFIERVRFDPLRGPTLRDLRQRAALHRDRDQFAAAADDLQRAEADDRDVPLVGVSYEASTLLLTGETSRAIGATVSIPWPARLSLSGREDATPFLTVGLRRQRTAWGVGLVSIVRSATIDVDLNRELAVGVSVSRSDPGPLERLGRFGAYTTLGVTACYTYGR